MIIFKLIFFLLPFTFLLGCSPNTDENNNKITVKDVWIREVLPGSDITAGYMTIMNHGNVDDTLIDIKCGCSEKVELHTTTIDSNDVARMKMIKNIKISSGETLELSPGSYHLMIMGIKNSMKEKDKVTFELNFQKQGKVIVDASIRGF
ncbi:MAG: copper chaperone PCu(A)C [Thermodesulfobacteriota bacterium]